MTVQGGGLFRIKRMEEDSMKVKTKCYGKVRHWPTKKAAVEYFTKGLLSCDPGSSESARYMSILGKLERGAKFASDENAAIGPLWKEF